ncbi:MAG TPA: hypothetical protein VNO33_17060 [Kofleriaceae bacterium]|nr:hypothetical protein [Kofleriaceae bacterium]
MSNQFETCHRHLLVRKPVGAVEVCHCGAVHLSIGGVTLRLVPAAIAELAELLTDAAAELPLLESALARRMLAPGALS